MIIAIITALFIGFHGALDAYDYGEAFFGFLLGGLLGFVVGIGFAVVIGAFVPNPEFTESVETNELVYARISGDSEEEFYLGDGSKIGDSSLSYFVKDDKGVIVAKEMSRGNVEINTFDRQSNETPRVVSHEFSQKSIAWFIVLGREGHDAEDYKEIYVPEESINYNFSVQ